MTRERREKKKKESMPNNKISQRLSKILIFRLLSVYKDLTQWMTIINILVLDDSEWKEIAILNKLSDLGEINSNRNCFANN